MTLRTALRTTKKFLRPAAIIEEELRTAASTAATTCAPDIGATVTVSQAGVQHTGGTTLTQASSSTPRVSHKRAEPDTQDTSALQEAPPAKQTRGRGGKKSRVSVKGPVVDLTTPENGDDDAEQVEAPLTSSTGAEMLLKMRENQIQKIKEKNTELAMKTATAKVCDVTGFPIVRALPLNKALFSYLSKSQLKHAHQIARYLKPSNVWCTASRELMINNRIVAGTDLQVILSTCVTDYDEDNLPPGYTLFCKTLCADTDCPANLLRP